MSIRKFLLGALFISACATAQPKPEAARPAVAAHAKQNGEIYKVEIGDAFVKGPADAKVTIVEFSDFQCAFCSRAQESLQAMAKAYGDELRFVFKNNPLPFHPDANQAALAALAAGRQGKFWEMHDLLFSNQRVKGWLKAEAIEQLAVQLGLDLTKYKSDLADPALQRSIDADIAQARQLGAVGTPSFFINGELLSGAQPAEVFSAAIEAAKARAEAKLAEGTPRANLYEALVASGRTDAPPVKRAPKEPGARKVAIDPSAPRRGAPDAKVIIVEVADFQCPYCGRGETTLAKILQAHPSEVAVVWMNQPLPFHKNAMPAAKAAMAAGEQGKFWEMHDRMFEHQTELTAENFELWAQALGLDLARWRQDQSSPVLETRIAADRAQARSLGANGTPTFFLNGKTLVGAQPESVFEEVIGEQLAKANALLQSGASQAGLYDALVEANVKEAGAR